MRLTYAEVCQLEKGDYIKTNLKDTQIHDSQDWMGMIQATNKCNQVDIYVIYPDGPKEVIHVQFSEELLRVADLKVGDEKLPNGYIELVAMKEEMRSPFAAKRSLLNMRSMLNEPMV